MLQLLFFILNLVTTWYFKFLGWFGKGIFKICRWLVYHPFQLATGILGTAIAIPMIGINSGVYILVFILGGSLAHLFDSTVADRNPKIPLFAYPFTGALAGACLAMTSLDSMLALMIAIALACGCYQQAHSKS